MHRYSIQPATMEKITLRRFHADWKPRHIIQIIKDRKLAIRLIAHDNPNLKIFTDSSGINDKIRASTILYQNNRKKATLRYVLGSTNHHTVYESESCNTLLATKLIMNKTTVNSVTIYTNNRATITASILTKPLPGHYILNAFYDAISTIKGTPTCPSNSNGYLPTKVLKGTRQLTKSPKEPPPTTAHIFLNHQNY